MDLHVRSEFKIVLPADLQNALTVALDSSAINDRRRANTIDRTQIRSNHLSFLFHLRSDFVAWLMVASSMYNSRSV